MTDNTELQQAVESLNTAFVEFKAANDLALKEVAKKGVVDPIITEKIDKLNIAIEEKSALLETASKEQKAAAERMDALETVLSRSGPGASDPKEDLELRSAACDHIRAEGYELGRPIDLEERDIEKVDLDAYKLYTKHFGTYIRRDTAAFHRKLGVPSLETKLLSVDRDPGGGYWVTPEMSGRITQIVFETSPIREFAAVEQIGSDSLEMISDNNQAGFGWVAEQESRAETTTPDVGKRTIFAHELYAEPRVTQKLLDDAGFNVERWLSGKVAERFARVEATAFVTGTGVGQPRGIATYPAGTADGQIQQVNSGTAGAVVADGLLDLVYSLKGPYHRNARFMAARLTLRDIRKLKDGQGRYLWEPIVQQGQPNLLLGFPIHQADDVAAVAANSLSIIFGDFKTAYTIVDRKGIRVLRDPFTAKPFVKLYTTRRVGGDIVNFEALKLQKLAA